MAVLERSKGGVFPHEISRMEEALGWLLQGKEGERRCLSSEALTARIRAVEDESMSCRGRCRSVW